jgi:hypothetical protein
MSDHRQTTSEEPIGIVISRGSREESPPRFVAYVWGQAEETPADAPEPQPA